MKIWWALIPLGIYYLVNNIFVLAFSTVLPSTMIWQWGNSESFRGVMETMVKMAGMFLGGISVYPFYKILKKEKETEEKEKFLPLPALLAFVLVGSFLGIGLNFLFQFSGLMQSSEEYRKVAAEQFAVPLWLALIFYGVLSPVVEEMVFRGIVYRYFCGNVSKIVAAVGSAALFGVFHGNVVQMIYGSIMGILFVVFYEKYDRLTVPILLHSAANISVFLFL